MERCADIEVRGLGVSVDARRVAESAAGIFVTLWVLGTLLGNFVWSQVIDRLGSRAALLGSGILGIASPAVACLVIFLPEGSLPLLYLPSDLAEGDGIGGRHVLFLSTFVMNAVAFNGRLISNMTFLLEVAPEDRT